MAMTANIAILVTLGHVIEEEKGIDRAPFIGEMSSEKVGCAPARSTHRVTRMMSRVYMNTFSCCFSTAKLLDNLLVVFSNHVSIHLILHHLSPFAAC